MFFYFDSMVSTFSYSYLLVNAVLFSMDYEFKCLNIKKEYQKMNNFASIFNCCSL